MNNILMVIVAWPELTEYKRDAYGVRGLLTCGHYSEICDERSSTWDFPHEVQGCPVCHEERQFDLRLQVALTNEDEITCLDLRSTSEPPAGCDL